MSNIVKVHQEFFNKPAVIEKVNELLGNRSRQFITSIMSTLSNNNLLAKSSPQSVYQAAMTAATMNLPVNPNLGHAYIVPYKGEAQLQIGYKGFIQLAQRSGQFQTISSTVVCEGQISDENPLQGYSFDWSVKSDNVIGYAAFFKLINGFEKTLYMSKGQIDAHAKKYSQSYGKSFSPWNSNFDEMAKKTVLKLLLNTYAPLSIDMQRAVVSDQAVVSDFDNMEVSYIDNEPVDEEKERLLNALEKCQSDEDFAILMETSPEKYHELIKTHRNA